MKYETDIEFPCGLKIYACLQTNMFESLGADIITPEIKDTICPIHGGKCKNDA